VLDRLDLEIGSGECVAIIGPSGCGKTTLLRLVAGLLPPDNGDLRVLGSTPQEARDRKAMGVMFQAPGLLPWRTAIQNVCLPLEVHRVGVQGSPARERAAQMLESVGLKGFERHLPRQLSGGMQQRVALARALITNPALLIMDEPFSALDELTRATLQRDFLRIREDYRPTVMLVTHSIDEAVRLGDRVVVLSPRPARIVEDVSIDLPGPRSQLPDLIDSADARAQIAHLRHLLKAG